MNPLILFRSGLLSLLALLLVLTNLEAQSRVKDVAMVVGARDNQLIGYGVVIGLNNQGDSDASLIRISIQNLIKKFGLSIAENGIKAKNAAAVMVTAKIPPFARNGSKLDVTISSIADAKALQGGMLLQTPLVGGDGQVYAVAQGSIATGGFLAGTGGPGGSSLQKNHPTVGTIPGGAIVEREIATDLFQGGALQLALRENDFTSAVRLANAINEQVAPLAQAVSGSTVRVFVPKEAQNDDRIMEFVARVENVVFRPDAAARIVINEKTGTIVANTRIRIDSVAVAHGNLSVAITSTQSVSQPNAFTGNIIGNNQAGAGGAGGAAASGVVGAAETPLVVNGNTIFEDDQGNQYPVAAGVTPPSGTHVKMIPGTGQSGVASAGAAGGNLNQNTGAQTVVTTQTTTDVKEEKPKFLVLDDMPTIQEVASALNSLGVTPRDMMSIFQSMKQAGALQAELVLQ
jgi:flagellar P-ring protein precursor FlgI